MKAVNLPRNRQAILVISKKENRHYDKTKSEVEIKSIPFVKNLIERLIIFGNQVHWTRSILGTTDIKMKEIKL